MPTFHRLPGLPSYGAPAQPFPAEWGRLGREGVVVEFTRADGRAWAGNFAPGLGGVSDVLPHPDGRRALVLARGGAWGVDPDTGAGERVATAVDALWPVRAPDGLVLSLQGLALARLGPGGVVWRTPQLSWDGFEEVRLGPERLTGLAWSAVDEGWHPFEVDLATGAATGGCVQCPRRAGGTTGARTAWRPTRR